MMEDHTIQYFRLGFLPERAGRLKARLPRVAPEEIRGALQEARGCVPWAMDGRQGLMLCTEEVYSRWLDQDLSNLPAGQRWLLRTVMLLSISVTVDERCTIHLGTEAAEMTGIKGRARLCLLSNGCILLLPEDEENDNTDNNDDKEKEK